MRVCKSTRPHVEDATTGKCQLKRMGGERKRDRQLMLSQHDGWEPVSACCWAQRARVPVSACCWTQRARACAAGGCESASELCWN
jgi:hypothetical protein